MTERPPFFAERLERSSRQRACQGCSIWPG